jgi:hypothetical protein
MRYLWPFIFLLLSLPAFAQHTYYVSKSSGSDANTPTQATNKSTPWQHLPGMAGCTGTGCANIGSWSGNDPERGPGRGYTPVAGDQFILYGGDTWTSTDLPMQWNGSGAGTCVTTPNSSCIYIGVDQTWYNSSVCGSSWCRPIFDNGGNVVNEYAMAYIYGTNVTLDNIEFKGLATSAGKTYRMVSIGVGGGGDVVEHCYFHGWSHAASGDTDDSFAIAGGASGVFHDNVVDGADTTRDMLTAVTGVAVSYNNYIAWVTSGFLASGDIYHDNWIGPVLLGFSGGHRNALQNAGPASASSVLIYNNIITGVQNGGMGQLWVEQNAANSGIPAYVFNNLEFNTVYGNNVDICQEGSSCGPIYIFNNTFACGSSGSAGHCMGPGGPTGNLYLTNNHCIQTASRTCLGTSGHMTVTETDDLVQSFAQANADTSPHYDQYTGSETYAYSPVASTNSTVGAGTNVQSLCTTIGGINAAAGTACQNSTSYACSYNTTNHTVSCPARTENSRPGGTGTDIGAYQFARGTKASQPCSPGSYTSSQSVTCINPNIGTTVASYGH